MNTITLKNTVETMDPLDMMSAALDLMIDCHSHIADDIDITEEQKDLYTRAADAALAFTQIMDQIIDLKH